MRAKRKRKKPVVHGAPHRRQTASFASSFARFLRRTSVSPSLFVGVKSYLVPPCGVGGGGFRRRFGVFCSPPLHMSTHEVTRSGRCGRCVEMEDHDSESGEGRWLHNFLHKINLALASASSGRLGFSLVQFPDRTIGLVPRDQDLEFHERGGLLILWPLRPGLPRSHPGVLRLGRSSTRTPGNPSLQ